MTNSELKTTYTGLNTNSLRQLFLRQLTEQELADLSSTTKTMTAVQRHLVASEGIERKPARDYTRI
jgi:hypothetical protein